MSIWNKEYQYYADGITKVTDPFWKIACDCGHIYLSVICNGVCPRCGGAGGVRTLGKIPYEQIVAERGEPVPFEKQ